MQLCSRPSLLVALVVAAFLLSACGGRQLAPVSDRTGTSFTTAGGQTAEQLELAGQYSLAARSYLRQAESAHTPQREHLMLKGLAALVKAGEMDLAAALLPQVRTEGLDPVLGLRRTLIEAHLALANRRPGEAITLTTPLLQRGNLDPTLLADIYGVHAQASLILHNHIGAINSLAQRERFLVDRTDIERNQQDLWAILESSPPDSLRKERALTADPSLRGWIDLALVSIEAGANPYSLSGAVEKWRRDYPNHPASETLLFALAPPAQPLATAPGRVALLLPLSSRFADAAQAFRDGFMAVHDADTSPTRPQIRLYDIGEDPVLAASFYDNAVRDGADFVVGPLGRDAAEQVARNRHTGVPTLLLADLDPATPVSRSLYQFSLAPEEEARQMAERAWLDGHRRAVVLHPDDNWGQRMRDALESQWRTLGGIVLETQPFATTETDHSDVVKRAFNIDESEQRAIRLENILHTSLESEPRRRQDIDCVFLAARASQARLLMPQINFHRGFQLPVYGTSQLYSGRPDPVNDTDLDGITFGDMPWILVPEGRIRLLRERLQVSWPGQHTALDRLYAFGADSYSLLGRLPRLTADPLAHYRGLSGGLSMDRSGRLHRQLVWARFQAGSPLLLDSYYNPMEEGENVETTGIVPGTAPDAGTTGGTGVQTLPDTSGAAPAPN